MTVPYPLAWPEELPRHKGARETGQFRTELRPALANAKKSLLLFGHDSNLPIKETEIVFSSNVGGLDSKVIDPGVALWFVWDGAQRCIAVDRYAKVEANLQAIHHILEADRTKLRHGSLAIVRAAYKGFVALPPPAYKKHWRYILEINQVASPTKVMIDDSYRRLAQERHPDKPGGSQAAMAELNAARDAAYKEIGPW